MSSCEGRVSFPFAQQLLLGARSCVCALAWLMVDHFPWDSCVGLGFTTRTWVHIHNVVLTDGLQDDTPRQFIACGFQGLNTEPAFLAHS
jgi:hypothetical protein